VVTNEPLIESSKLEFYIYENKLIPFHENLDLNNKETWNIALEIQETFDDMAQYFNSIFIESLYKINKQYKCVDCSNKLALSMKEINFFIEKGFDLPKRCKSCRDKRKLNKQSGGDK
ncbi:MAG TPA: zinc-ribbon domain containing protein, partial [Pseudoneobacillus sp.]|nr:zinc-ribbon domain containing protein [Pseudoneobacillus sp.]